MRNIILIGGSGFIGSCLAKRLNKDNDLNILDIVQSKVFPELTTIGDIRSINDLNHIINPDSIIINLAAEHKDNVTPQSLYFDVNVQGSENICQIADIKKIKKIIFISSVAVYGFAPVGTKEDGKINPFNEYGKTKWQAEEVYKKWQSEDPQNRSLVIIRPTVVFGEGNRGNVYNLLKQVVSGKFVMIGNGLNRKSMAYVENVAAFIEYSLRFSNGVYIFNYVDKPDFTMRKLIDLINTSIGKNSSSKFYLPYSLGLLIGLFFDFVAIIFRKKLAISSVRIKKFCSNSVYESGINATDFVAPIDLIVAIERTIKNEFS